MKYGKKVLSMLLVVVMMLSMIHPVNLVKAATNILIGKTYTNSTYNTSNPANAVGGVVSTFWDLGYYPDSPWITFELGDLYEITSVNVVNYYAANDRFYHYDVYASIDGENFTKIAEKRTDDYATSFGDTFTFDSAVYATHLKFVEVYNSANKGFHFNELAAYGNVATNVDEVALKKQELQSMILQSYYESDYTSASRVVYENAVENGKTVLNKEDASLQECNDVINAIKNAIENLIVGNPDEKTEGTFRVGTFNVWAPNPNHPDVEAIAALLDRIELDYIGLQELDKNNGRDDRDVLGLIETHLETISNQEYYAEYKQTIEYLEGAYGIGQIASTQIKEVTSGDLKQVNNEEQRSWMRM